jgi:hypothetical protein
MAIFKTPKINTSQRLTLVLDTSELVYDTDQKIFYGGDGSTAGGFPIGSNVQSSSVAQRIPLTQEDIDNAFIILSSTPQFPQAVRLTCEGGIEQVNGIDFEIIGNKLSWEGLGLDNFLDSTDVLIVQY